MISTFGDPLLGSAPPTGPHRFATAAEDGVLSVYDTTTSALLVQHARPTHLAVKWTCLAAWIDPGDGAPSGRLALDAASQQHSATLEQLQRAHDAALLPHTKATDVARSGAKACRQLHSRLSAFCDKWVPLGAEAEKLSILEGLKEIEEGLQLQPGLE